MTFAGNSLILGVHKKVLHYFIYPTVWYWHNNIDSIMQLLCHYTDSASFIQPPVWYCSRLLIHMGRCWSWPGRELNNSHYQTGRPESFSRFEPYSHFSPSPLSLSPSHLSPYSKDHDTVILKGACHGDGYKIGFGSCTGQILPAHSL